MTTSEPTENIPPIKFQRRYELDWLRAFAVFLVFIFHILGVFALINPAALVNDELTYFADVLIVLLAANGMPVFFIISGYGIFYSLKFLTGKQYVLARFIRLMVPYFFALFLQLPFQLYLLRIKPFRNPLPFVSFFDWLSGYYTNGIVGIHEGASFNIWGAHLWFLLFLFLMSVVALPLFLFLSKEKNRVYHTKVAQLLNRPGGLFLLLIPIILEEFIHYEFFPDILSFLDSLHPFLAQLCFLFLPRISGWTMISYFLFLFYGFFFAAVDESNEIFRKNALPALFFGVFLGLIAIPMYLGLRLEFLELILLMIYGWAIMIVILATAMKFLASYNPKVLKFLNEIGMPFYILHQTVMVVVGWVVIQLDLMFPLKFVLIVFISLGIILALIAFIRRVNVLRFLFGMRLKSKKSRQVT
jgi:peptidoglycan/LPS O-acetylase OafA/YrhL